MARDTGVVNIHGKEYLTVANRVKQLRDKHGSDLSIITTVLDSSGPTVTMRAEIVDASGRTIATGHAEEVRGSSNINKTSALENAETSAVGRALSFYGLAGTELASADEVASAISQQSEIETLAASFGALVRNAGLDRVGVAKALEARYSKPAQAMTTDDWRNAMQVFPDIRAEMAHKEVVQ